MSFVLPPFTPSVPTRAGTRRLFLAASLSLFLHALLFWPAGSQGQRPPLPASLQASLRPVAQPLPESPLPPPPIPDLSLKQPVPSGKEGQEAPPQARPAAGTPLKSGRLVKSPTGKEAPGQWRDQVRQHLHSLQRQGLFYPAEAIARGEQGEVLVLLLLDESGQVAAARVEQGSGYPLLDAAALRAVRSLSTLPADAPRESLLPVRFRLR